MVTGVPVPTCFFCAGTVPTVLRGRRFCCARCLLGTGRACALLSNQGNEKALKTVEACDATLPTGDEFDATAPLVV